ncbi:PH domain-containing protein [Lolliginicoccus suaedae]|uniref:PH domain-containing protein n=1 Tax=Lolliginicoccus suaedae TaxID=2605429 RepID=UPI001CA81EFF|nr:PH domain-containing protein [Lolliginicoccus suaedae]
MADPQRYIAEDENLIYSTRQHWTEMVAEVIILALIWLVAGAAIWVLPSGEQWGRIAIYVVIGLAVLASIRWWLVPLLSWRSTLYILTTKRIYKRSGFLTKTGRSIPLSRLNDISFRATVWERMMRYGTLTIQSASEQGTMTLAHVPDPEGFKARIYRAADEARGY